VTATGLSELFGLERGEVALDSGLTYDGVDPVVVHLSRRPLQPCPGDSPQDTPVLDRSGGQSPGHGGARYVCSDDGRAVALAGRPAGWRALAVEVVEREHGLNLSRHGVVSVPATSRQGPEWIASLPGRVAAASAALYSALLELEA
jgi:hypothetical protein